MLTVTANSVNQTKINDRNVFSSNSCIVDIGTSSFVRHSENVVIWLVDVDCLTGVNDAIRIIPCIGVWLSAPIWLNSSC
jgi:predicted glycosyltransferase involved in capsule biosynthesis